MIRHFVFLFFMIPAMASSQISEGGYPSGFDLRMDDESYHKILLDTPVYTEDISSETVPGPYRVGEPIPVQIDLARDGTWSEGRQGMKILRLGIRSANAKGLVLYYSNFSIPVGGSLYIYSKDRSHLIGAFTHRNNPSGGYFATEVIKGDEIVIEYDVAAGISTLPRIVIHQVHYIYKDIFHDLKGQSGDCEVNVNCPEGDSWQNEKRSVAKILLTDGKGSSLCTGSLLNNTMQDSIPYFLTARHCGSGALATHFAQWIFYFNYEAPTCEDPLEDPPSMTITGCEKVAEAPDGPGSGSDFRLLRLSSKPPEDYNPWFAGWRNDGMASSSGVGIHHPMGDVKKISTYTDPLISTNYGSIVPNPAGNYWKVTWSETMSGHGVTEGGSSGSPVFDNTGKVVGTLTGGAASCSNLLEPDFYGKFSSHWDANGSANDSWLKPWLDPENSGVQSLEGFGYGSILSANFSADTTVVSIGARVMFDDLSLGEPDKWEWTFDGGDPTHYTGQHPSGITYHEYGEYDVELKIHDGDVNNDIIKKKYIRVTPNVFPNPASDYITMDFGRRQLEFIEVNIYTISGMLMREYSSSGNENGIWKIQLDGLGSGTYILHIKTNVMEDHLLLMVN